jgi:hypothetical protein
MSQFRPKGGIGQVKPRTVDGFRPNYNNIFRADPRVALKAKEREGKCIGNDDTCGARKAKGTDWCVGHMRSLGLLEAKTEVTNDEGRADHSDPSTD